MKNISFVMAISLGFILSPSSAKSDVYDDQVKSQLYLLAGQAFDEGFDHVSDIALDSLRDSHVEVFSLTLRRDTEYVIVGACDNDCSDLDLFLYDENDNEVAEDGLVDSAPILNITPRWTGDFQLKVKMYACSNNPCRYGVMLLER